MKQLNSTDCAFFYFVGRVEGARVSSVEVLNVRVDEQLVPLASRFSSMQSSLSFSGFLYFMSTASHHRIASVWAYMLQCILEQYPPPSAAAAPFQFKYRSSVSYCDWRGQVVALAGKRSLHLGGIRVTIVSLNSRPDKNTTERQISTERADLT